VEEERKKSVYIFNTYLIEKLKSYRKECSHITNEIDPVAFEKTYNTVKKWTKDVDIFEKEFLLFPYNDSNQKHWSLFVVCFPNHFYHKEGTYQITSILIEKNSLPTLMKL
jgi:Protease, Ulp1 family